MPSITAEVTRLGWTTQATEPEATVRTILRRMVKRGQIVKVGRRYQLAGEGALL